ncbi:VOC family protein [Succinivibrio dextrinosolvens]|uniref:VOC family protein n=1 Tax=Succinivibrio dextrinosolvens TaxID=83771 RepID=UPI00247AF2F4|nr:VOC family protein [Succinivibrio dextrinosolvens]
MEKIKKIHHVGYLVDNIGLSRKNFESLGFKTSLSVCYDEIRQIDILFMNRGDFCIELICPREGSDIKRLQKKYKNSPYHICFEVESIDYSIEKLKEDGYLVFSKSTPAPAISSTAKVVFLFHTNLGIIELLEQ